MAGVLDTHARGDCPCFIALWLWTNLMKFTSLVPVLRISVWCCLTLTMTRWGKTEILSSVIGVDFLHIFLSAKDFISSPVLLNIISLTAHLQGSLGTTENTISLGHCHQPESTCESQPPLPHMHLIRIEGMTVSPMVCVICKQTWIFT